jgi:WD40 repeat protein
VANFRGIWAPPAWSPDGRRLATAGFGDVAVWDSATGQLLHRFYGHAPDHWINSLAWSPDGRQLASGGWDHSVKVWDTWAGRELHSLEGHTKNLHGLAFSPDGMRLASSSHNEAVKLWDPLAGHEVLTLSGPRDGQEVRGPRWSPDGRKLIGYVDRREQVWDASKGYRYAEGPELQQDLETVRRLAGRDTAVRPFRARASDDLAWQLATQPDTRLHDPERAVELARQAVAHDPHKGTYWTTLGVAQYRARNWQDAVAALTRAQELPPGKRFGANGFFLALAHGQLGNRAAARGCYDRAVEWMATNAPRDEELLRFRDEALREGNLNWLRP